MHTLYLASGSPPPRNSGKLKIQSYPYPCRHRRNAAFRRKSRRLCATYGAGKNAAAVEQWLATHDASPEYPILTADTTVAYQNHILGKPETEAQAAEILARLSGQTHQVLTAVCVYWQGKTHGVLQTSDVRFKTLSAEEISAYIRSGEPMDKVRVWHSGFGRRVCRAFARQLYRRDGPARLRNGRLVGTIRIEYSPICLILNTFKQTL